MSSMADRVRRRAVRRIIEKGIERLFPGVYVVIEVHTYYDRWGNKITRFLARGTDGRSFRYVVVDYEERRTGRGWAVTVQQEELLHVSRRSFTFREKEVVASAEDAEKLLKELLIGLVRTISEGVIPYYSSYALLPFIESYLKHPRLMYMDVFSTTLMRWLTKL